METRNIKVTLEKARTWYYSGNSTLKEIALQAFTERELKRLSYNEISLLVGTVKVPDEVEVIDVLAHFYKRLEDTFTANSTKFFIACNGFNEYYVSKHETVYYPGIPYFKRESDAKEALSIFLDYFKNRCYKKKDRHD